MSRLGCSQSQRVARTLVPLPVRKSHFYEGGSSSTPSVEAPYSPTPSHPSQGELEKKGGGGPVSMAGHIGPMFPRCQGRVPGRGQRWGCSLFLPGGVGVQPGEGMFVGWGEWTGFTGLFPGLRTVRVAVKTKERQSTISTPSPVKEGIEPQRKKMAFFCLSQQSGCPGSRPVPPLGPQQGALQPL